MDKANSSSTKNYQLKTPNEEIKKHVKEGKIFKHTTNEILRMFNNKNIGDVELLCEFISRMSENKKRRVNIAFKRHRKRRSYI